MNSVGKCELDRLRFDGKFRLLGLIMIMLGFLIIASVWIEQWSSVKSIGNGGLTIVSELMLNGEDLIIEMAAGVQNGTVPGMTFGLYQEMVVFSNIPFTALFVSLLAFSIVSFFIQLKNMRRNHKILYGLLFALCAGMIFNMLTRMGSELTLLIANKETSKMANQIVKGIDRVAVIFVIYIEILILSHICSIFLDTTRVIEKLSMQNYKRYRRFLVFLLIGIAGIFIILSMIVFVFAGLMSSPFGASSAILRYLLLALFLCGGLVFLGSSICITIMLTIIGRLLLSSMNNELKSTNNASFSVKQSALRKALTLQVGLSIALITQCLGFVCIPLSVLWEFSMYIFHIVYNLAIFIFIIFIVSIFNPLKDVQRFFKPKNKKFGETIGRAIAVSDSNVDDYYYYENEDEEEYDEYDIPQNMNYNINNNNNEEQQKQYE